MKVFDWATRALQPDKRHHASAPGDPPPSTTNNPTMLRKEICRSALRDVLRAIEVPRSWLTADIVRAGATRHDGHFAVIVVSHWDWQLLERSAAIQQAFEQRIRTLDTVSLKWLRGVLWKLPASSAAAAPAPRAKEARPVQAQAPAPAQPAEKPPAKLSRRELEQQLDQAYQARKNVDFADTQPMGRPGSGSGGPAPGVRSGGTSLAEFERTGF